MPKCGCYYSFTRVCVYHFWDARWLIGRVTWVPSAAVTERVHLFSAGKHAALTWNLRMMVQMRPRVRRWFPSTMSWEPMFSRWTLCSFRNCRALSTFSRQWILIRPFVGLGCNGKQQKRQKPEGVKSFKPHIHEGEETAADTADCFQLVREQLGVFCSLFICSVTFLHSANYCWAASHVGISGRWSEKDRLLQFITVYYRLLPFTTVYYRLLPFITVYYSLNYIKMSLNGVQLWRWTLN